MITQPPLTVTQQTTPTPPFATDTLHTIITIEPTTQTSSQTLTCPICCETYPKNEFYHSPSCSHNFCKNCMQEYLKERISAFRVLSITCPQDGCQAPLPSQTIKQLLDEKTFKSYETLALKKLALSDRSHRLCPMPGCARSYRVAKKSPYSKCKCGGVICNICGDRWHEGKTCLEVVDNEFKAYTADHEIRFCPICKTAVKRIEGCKHMTCPICDYEWCWDCGRQYSIGHATNCPASWSPSPPIEFKQNRIKEKWNEASFFTKFFVIIFLIALCPIWLVLAMLFWPLCLYMVVNGNLPWRKKPIKSFCLVIYHIFLGFLYSPVVLLCIFILLCCLVFMLPCILIGVCVDLKGKSRDHNTRDGQRENANAVFTGKRWLTGNLENFKYTSKAMPEADLQTVVVPMQVDRQGQE